MINIEDFNQNYTEEIEIKSVNAKVGETGVGESSKKQNKRKKLKGLTVNILMAMNKGFWKRVGRKEIC